MKKYNVFPFVVLLMLMALPLASCSSDDDEGRASALKGEDLYLLRYIEYEDGEEVRRGSANGSSSPFYFDELWDDGDVKLRSTRYYSYATWRLNGNAIVVSYFDSDDELEETERYEVENVYDDFGYFVLRFYPNDTPGHYYRISGGIDSDKYDYADVPDWWYEEWEY